MVSRVSSKRVMRISIMTLPVHLGTVMLLISLHTDDPRRVDPRGARRASGGRRFARRFTLGLPDARPATLIAARSVVIGSSIIGFVIFTSTVLGIITSRGGVGQRLIAGGRHLDNSEAQRLRLITYVRVITEIPLCVLLIIMHVPRTDVSNIRSPIGKLQWLNSLPPRCQW